MCSMITNILNHSTSDHSSPLKLLLVKGIHQTVSSGISAMISSGAELAATWELDKTIGIALNIPERTVYYTIQAKTQGP